MSKDTPEFEHKPGGRPTEEDLKKMNPSDMFLPGADMDILKGAMDSLEERPGVYEKLFNM